MKIELVDYDVTKLISLYTKVNIGCGLNAACNYDIITSGGQVLCCTSAYSVQLGTPDGWVGGSYSA